MSITPITTLRLESPTYWDSDHVQCRGIYWPVKDQTVNGYPVWQHMRYVSEEADYLPVNRFLYHTADGHWVISTEESMNTNSDTSATYWWMIRSDAPTPDLVEGQWTRWNSTHREWEMAPEECCVKPDPQMERYRLARLAQGESANNLVPLDTPFGRYVPIPDMMRFDRGVLRNIDVGDDYLRFRRDRESKRGYWCISSGEEMQRDKYRHQVESEALTPPLNWGETGLFQELDKATLASELERRTDEAMGTDVDKVSIKTNHYLMCSTYSMGTYWKVSKFDDVPTVMNGRHVWKQGLGRVGVKWTTTDEGLGERYLFYSKRGEWVIGNRHVLETDGDDNADKVGYYGEERDRVGWFRVRSNALTPDQITETWRALVPHHSVMGRAHWTRQTHIITTGGL